MAFTRAPRRLSLLGGKIAARVGVAVIVMSVALVIGWATAVLVAPGAGVDRTDWVGGAALSSAIEDFARLLVFVIVYAVIGTMIAVIVRSTPLALAVGLLWFGPIENVIGEGRSWATRWFPGLLLRSVLRPDAPISIATSTALATLVGLRRRRRDGHRGGDLTARHDELRRARSVRRSPAAARDATSCPTPGGRSSACG